MLGESFVRRTSNAFSFYFIKYSTLQNSVLQFHPQWHNWQISSSIDLRAYLSQSLVIWIDPHEEVFFLQFRSLNSFPLWTCPNVENPSYNGMEVIAVILGFQHTNNTYLHVLPADFMADFPIFGTFAFRAPKFFGYWSLIGILPWSLLVLPSYLPWVISRGAYALFLIREAIINAEGLSKSVHLWEAKIY